MKAKASDWYKNIWTLDIKQHSWVEETEQQTEHIIRHLDLPTGAKVLDLACGFGRHSLLLAQRGYNVTGVDITQEYITDARRSAADMGLDNAEFICCDIRELNVSAEYDLVLNLADGAIGYLENDDENSRIFDCIAAALKPGGHHVMDIINGEYADRHFPMYNWERGSSSLALSAFEWDAQKRIMLFGGADLPYGQPLTVPEISEGDPTRLYTLHEIDRLWETRGMRVDSAFAGFSEREASPDVMQMVVYSTKL